METIRTAMFAATVLCMAASTMASSRTPPPHPDCVDARQVEEVRQPDDEALIVALADGGRFRVGFERACPGMLAGHGQQSAPASLLAAQGWICGGDNEQVRSGTRSCAIATVRRLDAAEYASLARRSHRRPDGIPVLEGIEVHAQRRHRFAGSHNYCLDPRHVRGWSQQRDGLLVEMAPRRAGGNRWYRVELMHSCPELAGAAAIRLHSGVGIGMVCGNPRDHVSVHSDTPDAFATTGTARTRTLGAALGCPIAAVYPVDAPES